MDSVQFMDSTGVVYVSTAAPLPVTIATPSGTQPTIWNWTDISSTTPLPVTAS